MSESAITRLAEIRRMQGRVPLADPTRIEGFGPGLEPPPPMETEQVTDEPEAYDDPMEIPVQVHISKSPDHQPLAERQQRPASKELTVIERFATIHGYSVVLTEVDRNSVAKIILRAVERDLRGKVSEVTKKRRKRKEGAANNDSGVVGEAPVAPVTPKRRGRPKKVQ